MAAACPLPLELDAQSLSSVSRRRREVLVDPCIACAIHTLDVDGHEVSRVKAL